jgi:hypothetical protein
MQDETPPGGEPPAEKPKYDQEFFLALALKGKDVWNAWRRDPANKDVRVTFESVDFSRAPFDQIDFTGFQFGDFANFSTCKWRGTDQNRAYTNAFAPGLAFFDGATFGDQANFASAAFRDRANFNGARFGRFTIFRRAIFGHQAKFALAIFGDGADFTAATFALRADFTHAKFGDAAQFMGVVLFGNNHNFSHACFGNGANFTCATFGEQANFTQAVFGDRTNFIGVAFGWSADFSRTHFKGGVEFTGKCKGQWYNDLKTRLSDIGAQGLLTTLAEQHYDSWARYKCQPDHFGRISFVGARFDDAPDFSFRSYQDTADFTDSFFYYPPSFDSPENPGLIDFSGTNIGFAPPGNLLHWTSNTRIPLRLRRLRKIAEDTKHHDLERDLYIEERKAERGVYWRQLSGLNELEKNLQDIDEQKKHVWLEWRLKRSARNARWLALLAHPAQLARLIAHCFWIIVMWVYWALADYGRSISRPSVAWLLLTFIVFPWLYNQILMPPPKTADAGQYEQAVQTVAFANAVPFAGSLAVDVEMKKVLFCKPEDLKNSVNCHPVPTESYQWAVIGQNLFSIILVFFIGLALRNYFKIK